MTTVKVDIEWRKPDDLIPYPNNAKLHPQAQIDKLAGHMLTHGFDVPIVVDADDVIIKGHGRRLAAIQAKLKTVPTIKRDDLSDAQVAALRLADNRLSESGYDWTMLHAELDLLREQGLNDDDFLAMGFIDAELSPWSGDEMDPPKPTEETDVTRLTVHVPTSEADDCLRSIEGLLKDVYPNAEVKR